MLSEYKGGKEVKNSVVVGRKDADNEVCLRCGASRSVLKEMISQGGKGNLTIVNHILEGCPACKKALGKE